MCAFGIQSAEQRKLKDLQLIKDHISKRNSSVHPSSFAYNVLSSRIDEEIKILSARTGKKRNKRKKGKSNGVLRTLRILVRTLRILVIDAPMTTLFAILMMLVLLQKYYVNYILPTIDAAVWADDDAARLKHEFTYYSRECDVTDITAKSLDEVVIDEAKHTSSDVVENLMVHGMTMVPSLVDRETGESLRAYIMKRNTELTNDEVIPLDASAGRWSFGIHANEHPSVAATLEQLSNNPMLANSLEKILGRNPAVAEITAITVAPGAGAQGWHSDVKQLGNSLKYAQTFTHSYSLFVPLQDVTAEMGATELCPGTHYCGSEDLRDTCVKAGFQAAGPGKENVWKLGDGLVMNQKMWHRGGAYTAQRGRHRVVFIVTFISRPDPGVDHRQLSHGTYFHIHPRMYGHTLKDLQSASVYMAEPFASLRSLGIWKPPDSDWGWDWPLSSSVRIANEENGYSVDELFDFVESHSLALMIPLWLHGSVYEEGGWQVYGKETIENFVYLFMVIYAVAVLFVFTLTLVLDLVQGFKHRLAARFLKRLLCVNTTILLISYCVVEKVRSTQYAKSIENKTIFARPFVSKPRGKNAELIMKTMDSTMMSRDLSKPPRPTTVPEKNDILLGNRHDSKRIGYYKHYLNYHPGNKIWRDLLSTYYPLYNSYSDLPSVFEEQILSELEYQIETTGRMLTQNYYGDWLVMNDDDNKSEILKWLDIGINSLRSSLFHEIAILSAEARHGTLMRGSFSMSKETVQNLNKWKELIAPKSRPKTLKHPNFKRATLRPTLFNMNAIERDTASVRKKLYLGRLGSAVNLNERILVNYGGSGFWVPAHLVHREFESYGVAKLIAGGELVHVYLHKVKPFRGIQEGDEVAILNKNCRFCPLTYEEGTILMAYPDYSCDILHANGGTEERIYKDDLALKF